MSKWVDHSYPIGIFKIISPSGIDITKMFPANSYDTLTMETFYT